MDNVNTSNYYSKSYLIVLLISGHKQKKALESYGDIVTQLKPLIIR